MNERLLLGITAVSSPDIFQGNHLQILPKPLWKKTKKDGEKIVITEFWMAWGWTPRDLV